LRFIGIASRRRKAGDEIDAARDDAARRAALFHGLSGRIIHVNQVGAGSFDWVSGTDLDFTCDSDPGNYAEALRFDPQTDVLAVDGAVFVRFTYEGSLPGAVNYSYNWNGNGAPSWTTRPPGEIGGCAAGVGYARPQRQLRDTFIRSYENAAASIIAGISSRMTTGEADSPEGRVSSTLQVSEGSLQGFYVLEAWREPSTGAVWTLAIARPR
jgi:hypothetical protein